VANFQSSPGGQRLSAKTITVTRPSIDLALYGCLDFNGQELGLAFVDAGGSPFAGVTAKQGKLAGDTRTWTVSSSVGGKVRVEARTKAGDSWDWLELVFTGAPAAAGSSADVASVLDAVNTGRITGCGNQIRAVCKQGFFETPQGNITLSKPMFAVLAALSGVARLDLMSMMRYGHGFHGQVQADGSAVCSAMDIQQFGQFPINLIKGENVDNTISGIEALIRALPAGLYAFGLTRPSLHAQGDPMPDKDVFLPVKTRADIYKVGFPVSNPTPKFVNPKAAQIINAALLQSTTVRIDRMFEDGPDHVHLQVLQASN